MGGKEGRKGSSNLIAGELPNLFSTLTIGSHPALE